MFLKKTVNYFLLLFFFTIPFQTRWIYQPGELNGGFWEYGTLSLYATEILLWLIVVLFAIDRFRKRELWKRVLSKQHFKKHWLRLVFVLMFLCFNVLMIVMSVDWEISYQFMMRLLGVVCLGVVIMCCARNAMLALWLGGVLQGLLAIWQFFSQQVYASKWLGMAAQDPSNLGTSVVEFGLERWLRAYGSFGSPNSLGIYLAVIFVLGIVLYVKFRPSRDNMRQRILLTAGQLIILSGLLLSFSRGAWLATLIGLGLLIYIVTKRCNLKYGIYKQLFYYLVLTIFFLIILYPIFSARFNFDNRLEKISVVERQFQYGESLRIFSQSPLLGVGLGTYTLALHKNYPDKQAWVYQPVHSIYLLILAEVGLLVFVCLCVLVFLLLRIVWRKNPLFIPVIITLLVAGLFDHWLWSMYTGVVLCGVVFALSLVFSCSVQLGKK